MIINCYNGPIEHPGNQPIRVLRHNIAYSFQNYNPTFVEEFNKLSAKGYLTDHINYHINELPIFYGRENQLPFIQNGTINLHEIFLVYLWCLCFAIHTPFYKTIHEKILFKNDKILYNECNELLKFAEDVKIKYLLLDKSKRFNPECFDLDNERIIGYTNGMYVNALNFILSHEFAHAKYRLFNETKEDEERADYEAAKYLLGGVKNQNDFGNKVIAGLLGLGATMLLSNMIQSKTHPDSDKRIADYINNIGMQDENNEIWALAYFIYAHWDNEYKVNLDFMEYDLTLTYKERFRKLVEQ
jgi:hypothetical protein